MEEKVLVTEEVTENKSAEEKTDAKAPEKTTEAKSTAEKGSTKKGMDKKWGLLIGAVAAVCVGFFLLLTIIITIIVWPKKVNLNDYVIVEYEGYNTLGEAKVKIDEAAFIEKYGDKIKFSKKVKEYGINTDNLYGYTPAEIFLDYVSADLSQKTNLSNGQEITLTWNNTYLEFDEVFNYGIKYKEETFVVEGLKEVEMFDPFENIEVSFVGTEPEGKVEIHQKDTSGMYAELGYVTYENGIYSNGDVVKVYLTAWNDPVTYCAENYGVCPTATEKEYVVEGLFYPVKTIAEIPEESMNALIAQGQDVFNSYTALYWQDQHMVDSFLYQGSYLLTPKPGVDEDAESLIYMVYKVNARFINNSYKGNTFTTEKEFYYVVQFKAPVINDQNECVVDLMEYEIPYDKIEIIVEDDFNYSKTVTYTTVGYEDLNMLFNGFIQARSESYNCESVFNTN